MLVCVTDPPACLLSRDCGQRSKASNLSAFSPPTLTRSDGKAPLLWVIFDTSWTLSAILQLE